MRTHLVRRLGILTAAAIGTTVLALPVLPASASAATQKFFTVADTNGDGSYGVYSSSAPGGATTAVVAESDTTDVLEVSASHDGSRIVTVEDDYGNGASVRERVVVRDASGLLVRVVADEVAVSDTSTVDNADLGAKLSPDGNTVAWTHGEFSQSGSLIVLRTAPVSGGAPTSLTGTDGLVFASFLDDTTLIATINTSGAAVTVPVTGVPAGQSAQPVTGSPTYSKDFTVSPDGTMLAWATDRDPQGNGNASVWDIQVATLAVSGGAATLTGTRSLTSTLDNTDPAWVDSSTLDFVHDDGVGGSGDVWTVPADGLTPASAVATTSADEIGVAVAEVDSDAPAPATATVPFALRGSSATIAWTLPTGVPDLSGVLLSRSYAGQVVGPVFVPAPVTRFSNNGLVLGGTYTYTIVTVDRSGNTGPPATRTMTALTAGASFANPTSGSATTAPFAVTFGKGDPASAAFSVDYRANGGPYRTWVDHKAGVTRTFGAPSSGAGTTTSALGSTYRFRVTAFDGYGNSSAPVESGPAVVPYDQSSAHFSSGSATARYGDAWYHSVTVLRTAGATAVVTLPGHRFQLIGTRCPSCGVVDVYYGGRLMGSVDSYARTRRVRQVLFTVTWTSNAGRTLTVRARGTAHRPSVYVDAFTMWR